MKKNMTKLIITAAAMAILAGCASTGKTDDGTFNPATQAKSFALPMDNQFGFNDDASLTTDQLLSLRSYYFAFDQTELTGVNLQAVKAQGLYLSTHPNQVVLLEGNADIRGSREYNIGLGWRRGQAVAKVLMAQGAARDQLFMVSYGAEKPLALGNTEDDYTRNRRVDLLYCKDKTCDAVYKQDGLKSDF